MAPTELKALSNDHRKVNIVWHASAEDQQTYPIFKDYPRAAAELLSPYCKRQSSGKPITPTPTVTITGETFDHVRRIFRAIGVYCNEGKTLPEIGELRYFDALKLNEAARLLQVKPIGDSIWTALLGLRYAPLIADVKAVLTAYPPTDSRPGIVTKQLAIAIVEGRFDRNDQELVELMASKDTFRNLLQEKTDEHVEKAEELERRRRQGKKRRGGNGGRRGREEREELKEAEQEMVRVEPPSYKDKVQFPELGSVAEKCSGRRT
jgi:hypothetical protein